jgi:predicted alpha/beta-fold hydrolase
MRKTVEDLLMIRGIADTYQIIVYENPRKSSLEIQEEVVEYINTINRETEGGLEELIILGFSAGGILASHVMHQLTDLSATKKIITYDTPFHMVNTMQSLNRAFVSTIALRYFHYEITSLYYRHYNYMNIKHHILPNYSGLESSLEMVEKIHGLSREQLNHYCRFQVEQLEKMVLVNIYCKYDPVVHRDHSIGTIQFLYPNWRIYNVEKPLVGHCSDMVYGRAYLKDIIEAIERK